MAMIEWHAYLTRVDIINGKIEKVILVADSFKEVADMVLKEVKGDEGGIVEVLISQQKREV